MAGQQTTGSEPTAESRLGDLVRLLQRPDLARPMLSQALTELALLAGTHRPALDVLLVQMVERGLADAPIRAFFFDDALVDDAVQETVLAVAADIGGFRGDAAFTTWLDRVAANVARQMRRRGNRLSEPVSNELPELVRGARRLSSIVADEQTVAGALAALTEEHRRIILLREVHDLSYDEIAVELSVPVGTVRSRLQRARRQLAGHLVAGMDGAPR